MSLLLNQEQGSGVAEFPVSETADLELGFSNAMTMNETYTKCRSSVLHVHPTDTDSLFHGTGPHVEGYQGL